MIRVIRITEPDKREDVKGERRDEGMWRCKGGRAEFSEMWMRKERQ